MARSGRSGACLPRVPGSKPINVAIFMSVAVAAGALGQWPFGRLSDTTDRRMVLLALLGLSTIVCFAVFFASPTTLSVLLICGFAFGLVTLPAYSIVVAHAYDHAEPDQYVTMASGLLLIFAMGSICGPLIAAVFLERLGPGGLFLFMAIAQLALAGYVLVRLRLREAVPQEEREDFSFAATSQIGAVLSETDLDEQDVDLIEPDPVTFDDEEDE
jgi:MFS family permease